MSDIEATTLERVLQARQKELEDGHKWLDCYVPSSVAVVGGRARSMTLLERLEFLAEQFDIRE